MVSSFFSGLCSFCEVGFPDNVLSSTLMAFVMCEDARWEYLFLLTRPPEMILDEMLEFKVTWRREDE